MTREDFDLTMVMSLLPTIADKLEDLPFKQRAKQIRNDVVNSIRKQDKFFMDSGNLEIYDQQNKIQRAFLQWLDEMYKNSK